MEFKISVLLETGLFISLAGIQLVLSISGKTNILKMFYPMGIPT